MLLWKIPEDLLKEIKASNCYTLIFGEATGLSKKSSTLLFKICWQQKNFWNLHKVMIALLVNICLGLWKKTSEFGQDSMNCGGKGHHGTGLWMTCQGSYWKEIYTLS